MRYTLQLKDITGCWQTIDNFETIEIAELTKDAIIEAMGIWGVPFSSIEGQLRILPIKCEICRYQENVSLVDSEHLKRPACLCKSCAEGLNAF
ncbi:MAG: hypothetical protein ACFFCQ_09205 [Promethearchaeota archaeon]